jgi:hypothetical protein
MALTYGEISAITERYFVPKLVDNIFGSNALLARAKQKWYDKADGGSSCMVPLLYATTSANQWYQGADNLNVTANDQITAAEFAWKFAQASIVISHSDEIMNKGKAQMVDFVAAKVQAAEKTLADTLGTGIFNDGTTTAKAFQGLQLMCATTGTYGGIAKATYAWWAAQADASTAVLSLAKMQALYGDCTVGNDKPTVLVSYQNTWDDYHGLLQPQMRFQDTETANAGFINLMYNSAPFVVDSHCASGALYMLNEDYLSLKVLSGDDFRFEKFARPVNQAVAVGHIYWSGALTCSNCRMQGAFTAISN